MDDRLYRNNVETNKQKIWYLRSCSDCIDIYGGECISSSNWGDVMCSSVWIEKGLVPFFVI